MIVLAVMITIFYLGVICLIICFGGRESTKAPEKTPETLEAKKEATSVQSDLECSLAAEVASHEIKSLEADLKSLIAWRQRDSLTIVNWWYKGFTDPSKLYDFSLGGVHLEKVLSKKELEIIYQIPITKEEEISSKDLGHYATMFERTIVSETAKDLILEKTISYISNQLEQTKAKLNLISN